MAGREFVYVTYIASTAQKVWDMLTQPDFTEKFWLGGRFETNTQPGTRYQLVTGGVVNCVGEILECDPPHRLVFTFDAQTSCAKDGSGKSSSVGGSEAPSRVTYTIEQGARQVKLTIVHDQFAPDSKVIEGVSNGWPAIISNLKSLLETGETMYASWADMKPAAEPAAAR